MKTLFIATGNRHKVEELSGMFARENLDVTVKGADALGGMPEVDETEETFEGNATLKVQALVERLTEGEYALADDSGIAVDALGGAPGVLSARFAGPQSTDILNLTKLLILATQIPEQDRGAQFVCSLVLADYQGNRVAFQGICRGHLITQARGEHGFGYDPMFVPEGYSETFGELGWDVKSRISHRARALQQLVDWMRNQVF